MRLSIPVAAVLLVSSASAAESKRTPLPPAYVEECGSCHVAFPGRMLDAASWQAVIGGLSQHFGGDASVDAKTLEPIRAYLEGSARRKSTAGADGKPLLRITETRWFVHEHDEVPSRLRPGGAEAVKPAACGACHQQAATGSYAERDIQMPRKGATR